MSFYCGIGSIVLRDTKDHWLLFLVISVVGDGDGSGSMCVCGGGVFVPLLLVLLVWDYSLPVFFWMFLISWDWSFLSRTLSRAIFVEILFMIDFVMKYFIFHLWWLKVLLHIIAWTGICGLLEAARQLPRYFQLSEFPLRS